METAVTCAKHMVYGPCGGDTTAGGCEVDAELRRPCRGGVGQA